jgi:hypothetical protein
MPNVIRCTIIVKDAQGQFGKTQFFVPAEFIDDPDFHIWGYVNEVAAYVDRVILGVIHSASFTYDVPKSYFTFKNQPLPNSDVEEIVRLHTRSSANIPAILSLPTFNHALFGNGLTLPLGSEPNGDWFELGRILTSGSESQTEWIFNTTDNRGNYITSNGGYWSRNFRPRKGYK